MTAMSEILVQIFAMLGSLAVLLAAVGVARFPDFFTRAHAATKASAFGIACLLVAVCVSFPTWNVIGKAFFSMIALFLTLPVASQALADAMRGRDPEERKKEE